MNCDGVFPLPRYMYKLALLPMWYSPSPRKLDKIQLSDG